MLTNVKKLRVLNCYFDNSSYLSILKLTGCSGLQEIYLYNAFSLKHINWNTLQSKELKILDIRNSVLSEQDLSSFGQFKNLETLLIGNDGDWVTSGYYNRFHGSLKPLQSLTKLKKLIISNTDIDSGLEYLPKNVWDFHYAADKRKDSKVKIIEEQLTPFGGDLELWREANFYQKNTQEETEQNVQGGDAFEKTQNEKEENKNLLIQLQTENSHLKEQVQELSIQLQSLKTQSTTEITPSQPTNLPAPIIPESEKETLSNFLENYIAMMNQSRSDCLLIINHEAATEKEKEHFTIKKQQLEYKIEQAQNFTKK